ncbi:MAG: nicotinamide mononucleotide transporter [Clostridiales bacterium]|nr:nicotinamide mononucleotide transporter [Clostridiales bacterium]
MKKFLKSFTPYQITYLVVVFVMTALFIIIMPENMLDDMSNPFVVVCSVIATLANPVCELLISKQSKWNFVVDAFLIEIPELIICIALGWYTIAIVTMLFWIPIDVVSFIKWRHHPDEEEEELTVVKRLTVKQDILVVLAIIAFGFGVGQLISMLPGAADSYLDALSAACGMANGILLLLRFNEQWYAWFMTLILYTILYITSGSYIMLITVAAMFVNTCYGFGKWLIYTKKHANADTVKQSE